MKSFLFGSLAIAAVLGCNKPTSKATDVSEVESASSAASSSSSRVLVVEHSGGGLIGGHSDLKILENGKITFERQFGPNPLESFQVATLSSKGIQNLKSRLSGLTSAPLRDESPGTPHCMDAGSSTIKITNSHGSFDISQNSGCHKYSRQDGAGSDIVNLINGLSALTY